MNCKRSINHTLARGAGAGADPRSALYGSPSAMFRKRSINHTLARGAGAGADPRSALYGSPSAMFQGSRAS